ncbi:MAG: type II toxin-antitoxin system RelE/ParE family toxin [Desulfobulbaceae bacterium]|nr:type II toxin-antitoxin system RelE/ParE family toxin [Desulfobulbaceae bacterium]
MRVEWHAHAILDLQRLKEFIFQQNKEAAERAIRLIKAAVMQITTHPRIGKPVEGFPDYHEIVIPFGTAGYVVRYRIKGDTALIIAIKHGKEAGFNNQSAKLWVIKDPEEEQLFMRAIDKGLMDLENSRELSLETVKHIVTGQDK